jgi:cell division protein FtsI/penicillin-binding protein 2
VGIVERRIGLLFACFLALLFLAAGRAVWLATVENEQLTTAAASQQTASVEVPARRGTIIDRKGIELAVDQPAADVSATPYLVENSARVAGRLAPLLGKPVDEVAEQLGRRDTGFAYLARGLPGGRAERIRRLRIAGIQVTPGHRRFYPQGELASQVLGTVGTDGKGLSGLEYSRDDLLEGRDGQRRLVKDALGESIRVRDPRPARPGSRLELTIDAAIQEKVERVLMDVGRTYRPKGATAFVTDPRTGAVLALANWPRVDANVPAAAPGYASQNRAVGFTYEPGSTFKAFTVAGALEDGTVTPRTTFTLPPQILVADRIIGESHPRGTVTLTTGEILAQSSNVGAVTIGQRMGKASFDRWVRRFGFGRATGVDLPGEERGLVLPVERYSGSSMGNLPIGQGVSVTPMQMAAAYGAIANGGVLRPPHVVGAVDGRLLPPPRGRRVISPTTSRKLREMLEGAFAPGGTASEVAIKNYALAGKTGTANKIDPQTGTYSQSRYIASFIGFAPALDPRLLIGVVVDEPQGAIYGGQVAAPAFGRIASFALPYLRIPPG